MNCDCTWPQKTELPEDVVRSFTEFQALEDGRRRFMANPVSRMKFAAARHAVVSDIWSAFGSPGFTWEQGGKTNE